MNLMTLLPEYYLGNQTMEELQEILTSDINDLAASFNETVDQCFVKTAAALLSRYEKIYGISIDTSKNDDFRRERIMAKMRGVGTVTKQMLVDTARTYSNGEVEVTEDSAANAFKIKFVGTIGMPPNMADLTLTMEEIKPAHMSFTFEYVYNTHDDLHGFTHSQLGAYTHYQLRNEVLN